MIVEDRKCESCPTCHRVKYTGQAKYVCDGCEQIVAPPPEAEYDGEKAWMSLDVYIGGPA